MNDFELMQITRSKLNPIGQLIYDYFRKTESRKISLLNALEAQDCFLNIEQARAWISAK